MNPPTVIPKRRLDENANPQWNRTTKEENFLWVATIIAHKEQALRNEDPCLGFYGAVQNKKDFVKLARRIKAWFAKEHGIEDIPVYMMELSWQNPHVLTIKKKDFDDLAVLGAKATTIVAWAYKKSFASAFDMELRQQTDRTKDPYLTKLLKKKTYRKLVDPKKGMPGWKRQYMERVEAEKARLKAESDKARAQAEAELQMVEECLKNKVCMSHKARGNKEDVDIDVPIDDDEENVDLLDGEYEEDEVEEEEDEEEEEAATCKPDDDKRPYAVPDEVKKAWGMSDQNIIAISSIMSNEGELLFYINAVYNTEKDALAHIQNVLIPRIDGPIVMRPLPMFCINNMATLECRDNIKRVYADKALNEALDPKTAKNDPAAPPSL